MADWDQPVGTPSYFVAAQEPNTAIPKVVASKLVAIEFCRSTCISVFFNSGFVLATLSVSLQLVGACDQE